MKNFLFTKAVLLSLCGSAAWGAETFQVKSVYTQIPGNTVFLTKNLQSTNLLQYEFGTSSSATGVKSVLWLRNEQGGQIPINTAFEYINIKFQVSSLGVASQAVREQLNSCFQLASIAKMSATSSLRFSFSLNKAIPIAVNLNRTEIEVKVREGDNEIKSIECGL